MKYFILHTSAHDQDDFSREYYIKGKSLEHVSERIERYSNGYLSTTKFDLMTNNLQYGFLQEVILNHYPNLSPRDFALINENGSYNLTDLE